MDESLSPDRAHLNGRRYLTPKEAAPIVGLTVNWLYTRIGRAGGPPYVRRGARVMFPREEFMKWASQKVIP